MLDDDFTRRLRVLGLERLPARLYQCLLNAAPAALPDLGARVGEDDLDAVEAGLQELVELGLIGGGTAGHRPIAPGAALTILERRRTARIHAAKAAVLQTYEDFHRTMGVQPQGGMEMLDPAQTRLRRQSSVNAARQQVRVFDTPPYENGRREPNPPRPRDGVAYRTIYSRDALEFPGHLAEVVLPAISAGEQTAPSLRSRSSCTWSTT